MSRTLQLSEKMEEILIFLVEWYDPLPQLKKKYILKYFPSDHMVEMVDIKSRKLFLRKSPCPNDILPSDFNINKKVFLFSRELDIVDYGDAYTRDTLHGQIQSAICWILSSKSYQNWGKIIKFLQYEGKMDILMMRSFIIDSRISSSISEMFNIPLHDIPQVLPDDQVHLLFITQTSSKTSVDLNKIISTDIIQNNFILNCYDYSHINSIDQMFFKSATKPLTTATYDSCTCSIVKPHAIKRLHFGAILDEIISAGYEVSAIQSIFFSKVEAEEFLEVYKGVVPDFKDHVIQLSSGISIALEIRAENSVSSFRISAGPWDVGMAKELRPNSIRAKYGEDNVKNAIHCTDLDDDAVMECQYVFHMLV